MYNTSYKYLTSDASNKLFVLVVLLLVAGVAVAIGMVICVLVVVVRCCVGDGSHGRGGVVVMRHQTGLAPRAVLKRK